MKDFRKIKEIKEQYYWVFCVDNFFFFFLHIYIKGKYYWVFWVDNFILFFCVYEKEKYYWVFCVDNYFFLVNIRMLEMTIDNRYKCDLETIIDYPNNSQ